MNSHDSSLLQLVKSMSDGSRYGAFMPQRSMAGGRPPVLPPEDIVAALTWHVLQPQGTFSQSLFHMRGIRLSDSTLSERRQAMGADPWLNATDAILGDMRRYGESAFYKGLRLVGIDGTSFSVANTPTMKTTAKKVSNKRGESAFFHIPCVAMCDLASHSPLAIRVGIRDESEAVLAKSVMECLTENDLFLGDRYYGNGKNIGYLQALDSKPMFLVRVVDRNCFTKGKKLSDGSHMGDVFDTSQKKWIQIREVKGRVRRPGRAWTEVRFWTNLHDEIQFPALEILRLYAYRWEQEIAFREIKKHIKGSLLLSSHTPVTARQEVCALFLVQSVIASIRITVHGIHGIPVLQVSFQKTVEICRCLCNVLSLGKNVLTNQILSKFGVILEISLEWTASKVRRKRSCPRKVRKPVNNWPCLRENVYCTGDIEAQVNV